MFSIYNKIIMNERIQNLTSLSDFQPLEKIGEGSFSSVYKVKRATDGKIYALKKVRLQRLSEREINNSLNEVRILASIESPFIIHYKEAFFDMKVNVLCIVMEFANERDLQKLISKHLTSDESLLPESEIWKAAAHILSGLQLLHSKGILHRDLKTANIFINDGVYKIGDMNVSKIQSEQQLAYTQTGTPYYASPEVWRDEPYDAKSDIWSFGCIIYQMCTFHPPFQGKDIQSLYKSIKKGKFEKIPDIYSGQLADFICNCLNQVAKKRPTAFELMNNKNSIINQKCNEYGILLKRQSSFNLLKTINYKTNQLNIGQKLPMARYQLSLPLKNRTEETLQRSPDEKLSPEGVVAQYSNLATQKKHNKLIKIQKYQEKITAKLRKMLKFAQDKTISETDRKCKDQVQSMKNILDLHDLPRQSCNEHRSERLLGPVDTPLVYPKITRARNLTNQRIETTQDEVQTKGLDVIKEIRKRRDQQRNKQKKIINTKIFQPANKKHSSVNLTKQQHFHRQTQKGQSKQNIPAHSRQEKAFNNHLRKMSQKMSVKKYSSIPYLNRATNEIRIETEVNRVQAIAEEEGNTKRAYYLKKKSKNNKCCH